LTEEHKKQKDMKTQERKRVIPYFLLMGVFLFLSFTLKATNVPITTAGTVCNAVANQQVTVPVTVTGFSNISGFTLTMDYDYSRLHFVKASSTSNSSLGGTCDIGEINMGGNNRRVTISWYRNGTPGITLPDGSAIANYVFTYISGPAALTWFDMGPSCVYNDPDVNTLNDTPTSTYYINGLISGSCQTTPTLTVGTITDPVTCSGNGSIPLTFTNVPDGTYTINYTGGSFSNVAVSGNAATITASVGTYTNLQITVGGVISATGVNATVTQPLAPAIPAASATLQPTCGVTTGTITVTAPTGSGMTYSINGTTYTNSDGIFTLVPAGVYSVTAKSAAGCISQAASVTINDQPLAQAAPTASATLQPTCGVATGTITVTAPTGSGMTYRINGTTYTNSNGIFTLVPAGIYSVTAKSAAGCISQAASVTINDQPLAPATPTASAILQPTCGVTTGTITVTAPTGSGMTYSINGTTYTNSNGIYTLVPAGIYSVTAKSAAGCISQAASVTINDQPLAPAIQSATVTPTSVIGSGQVLFSATASSGTIKWYDAPTGGTEITDLNPIISVTTTYYAEAITDAGCVSTSRTPVTATVFPQGTTQLSYRFTNPEITNLSGTDYFEFDVEVKANEPSYFWTGNVNLDFNNNTLSSNPNDWSVMPAMLLYYSTPISIVGSNLNIDCKADIDASSEANTSNFAEITTAYQTLFTVRAKITDQTGVAGIDFNEDNMNGKQFYYLSERPWYGACQNPNNYDPANFTDTYAGRVYATKFGWTQVGNLNWSIAVNTSLWEGEALVPLANASNLRIHNHAQLTIPVDGEMTITGNIDIKPANGLIIESDASGTGSLITGTALGTGSAVANRYMTTGAWHIVASPVSGQSITGFLAINANVATDEVDNTVRGMMDYNPAGNLWNDYFTNSTPGLLETGKGFCMRTNANSSVSFEGALQAGDQSASGLTPDKWNCIGNPYTSAIGINNTSSSSGATNFLDENATNFDPSYGAIYVWDNPDANNGLEEKYTVISNASAGFDIQQEQAFLVKMNTTATSVGFNSGMQIHQPSLDLKSAKNVWPTINLQVSSNSQKSSTVIAFNSGMTKGLDPTYDAGLLKGSTDLSIYSHLVEDNGIPFAIQALPDNDYTSLIIPIGLDFKTGGEVVFSASTINLPPDCMLILEDKLAQSFTDLSKNVYSVTIAANLSSSDRFRLHTSYLTTGLNIDYFLGKLSAYAVRNVEIRVKGQVSNQAIATLYDIQGREILVEKLDEGSINVINTPNIKSSIYLLFVNDNGKSQGFKIPVRE